MNLRESFALPYAGGELWYSCLDGLGNDVDCIRAKILAEGKQIAKPSCSSYIIYHLYGTELNEEMAQVLLDNLLHMTKPIQKIAFTGVSKSGKQHMLRYLRSTKQELQIAYTFFDDMEKAKEWLL